MSSFAVIHAYGLEFMNSVHSLKLSGSSVYFLVLEKIFSDLAHAFRIKWKYRWHRKLLSAWLLTCVTDIITQIRSRGPGPWHPGPSISSSIACLLTSPCSLFLPYSSPGGVLCVFQDMWLICHHLESQGYLFPELPWPTYHWVVTGPSHLLSLSARSPPWAGAQEQSCLLLGFHRV